MKNNLVKILSAITLTSTLTFSFATINNVTIAQEEATTTKPSVELANVKVKLVGDKLYFYAPDFANKTVLIALHKNKIDNAAASMLEEIKIASDGLINNFIDFYKNDKDYIYGLTLVDENADYSASFSHDEILKLLGETETVANPVPKNNGTVIGNNAITDSSKPTTEDKKENKEDKKTIIENKTKEDKKQNANNAIVQKTKNLPKTSAVK